MTATSTLGAFLGSLVVFQVADGLGRRRELQVGSSCYLVGALITFLSGHLNIQSSGLGIAVFLLGRLVYGVGIGFSMHGAPTYIAEMAPPQLRGLLISLKEAFIVIGILAGYLIGYLLKDQVSGWTYMYGCSAVLSSLMFFGTFFIPDSVRWLLLSGLGNNVKEAEALASYKFVFDDSSGLVPASFDEMRSQISEQVKSSANEGTTFFDLVRSPRWRGPLIAGVGLVVLQQVTGQPSILSYATPILSDAGLDDSSAVFIGTFKLVATMFAVAYVDSRGRKPMLFVGCSLMLCALVALTISFFFAEKEDGGGDDDSGSGNKALGARQWVTLVAMFCYIGGYQVGFGPIAWLMISEIFPLSVRGQAVAFAVQMNFLCNTLVQFGIPVIQDAIGTSPLFMTFTVLCAYAIYFVHRYVPETKGLTLEEITKFFDDKRGGEEADAAAKRGSAAEPLLTYVDIA